MARNTQITVRIPAELAARLDETASARRVVRSDVVCDALRLYLDGTPGPERPWDRIGDLAGVASGGPRDLGARHRKYLKEILGGS